LHITPGKRPALEREFNEAQVTNDVIENDSIIEITPSFIPIIRASIEIEITHKQPKVIIVERLTKQPINKYVSSRLSTGTINHHQGPRNKIVGRGHDQLNGKGLFLNNRAREVRGGPAHKNTPRSPNRGTKFKPIKPLGSKFSNKE
jgi:hypothetical protein